MLSIFCIILNANFWIQISSVISMIKFTNSSNFSHVPIQLKYFKVKFFLTKELVPLWSNLKLFLEHIQFHILWIISQDLSTCLIFSGIFHVYFIFSLNYAKPYNLKIVTVFLKIIMNIMSFQYFLVLYT